MAERAERTDAGGAERSERVAARSTDDLLAELTAVLWQYEPPNPALAGLLRRLVRRTEHLNNRLQNASDEGTDLRRDLNDLYRRVDLLVEKVGVQQQAIELVLDLLEDREEERLRSGLEQLGDLGSQAVAEAEVAHPGPSKGADLHVKAGPATPTQVECVHCAGVIGPDRTGRPMCYGCGPEDMLPSEDVQQYWEGLAG